jgi:hypothetical protein
MINLTNLLIENDTNSENIFVKEVMILNKSAFKIAGIIVPTKRGFTGYLKKYVSSDLPAAGFRSRPSFSESYGDTLYKTEKPFATKEDCIKHLEQAANSLTVK